MMVGADTGPIIALGKVDRIALLAIFEAPIVIPPHGRRELLSKPTSETQEIERALRRRIQVREVPARPCGTNGDPRSPVQIVSPLAIGAT